MMTHKNVIYYFTLSEHASFALRARCRWYAYAGRVTTSKDLRGWRDDSYALTKHCRNDKFFDQPCP